MLSSFDVFNLVNTSLSVLSKKLEKIQKNLVSESLVGVKKRGFVLQKRKERNLVSICVTFSCVSKHFPFARKQRSYVYVHFIANFNNECCMFQVLG